MVFIGADTPSASDDRVLQQDESGQFIELGSSEAIAKSG
jgi:hypothetical protein